MDDALVQHPSDDTLKAFGLGKLDGDATRRVDQHLDSCVMCLQKASELVPDKFLDRLKRTIADGGPGVGRPVAAGRQDKGQTAVAGRVGSRRTDDPVSTVGVASQTTIGGPDDLIPPELANHADYEIRRELGRGGMGVVYLAYNRLMGRNEVLKVMGRHIIERPGVMDRFLREIRAVAQLRHPNVVTAYTAFRNSESFVFAMEYVEGLDLARMVAHEDRCR